MPSYQHLQAYLERIYRLPGIADTANFDHIKRHYDDTHDDINPRVLFLTGRNLTGSDRCAI
jgi:putative glutathione S-transferase